MNEQTIAMSRYNDLQCAYQDCHEKLLAAVRKADKLRSDNILFSSREDKLKEIGRCLQDDCNGYRKQIAELNKAINALRSQKNIEEVERNILRINYEASLTNRSILRKMCRNWETKCAALEEQLREERLKKLPFHQVVQRWWSKRLLA